MTGYFLQGRCSIPVMGRHYLVTFSEQLHTHMPSLFLVQEELSLKAKCQKGNYLLFTSIWYEDSEWVFFLGVALSHSMGRTLDSKLYS